MAEKDTALVSDHCETENVSDRVNNRFCADLFLIADFHCTECQRHSSSTVTATQVCSGEAQCHRFSPSPRVSHYNKSCFSFEQQRPNDGRHRRARETGFNQNKSSSAAETENNNQKKRKNPETFHSYTPPVSHSENTDFTLQQKIRDDHGLM